MDSKAYSISFENLPRSFQSVKPFYPKGFAEILRSKEIYLQALYYLDIMESSYFMLEQCLCIFHVSMLSTLKWCSDADIYNFWSYHKYLSDFGFPKSIGTNYKSEDWWKYEKKFLDKMGHNISPLGIPEIYELMKENISFAASQLYVNTSHEFLNAATEDYVLLCYMCHMLLVDRFRTTQEELAISVAFSLVIAYVSFCIYEPYPLEASREIMKVILDVKFITNQEFWNMLSLSRFKSWFFVAREEYEKYSFETKYWEESKQNLFRAIKNALSLIFRNEPLWMVEFNYETFMKIIQMHKINNSNENISVQKLRKDFSKVSTNRSTKKIKLS
jgi:hypothetical protein